MPFILSEDLALKTRMQGMYVSDGNTQNREVGVWFGQPDKEIRAQDYPFVVINLININEARERVASANLVALEYLDPPQGYEQGEVLWDRPIPVNMDYQVSSFSRHPRHDRGLLSQMLMRLPMRGGLIGVTHDKEDEMTVRRLDFLGLNKRDRIEDNKRLFVNDITVRISSEMYPQTYKALVDAPTSLVLGMNGSVTPPYVPSPWGPNPGPPDPLDPDVPANVESVTSVSTTPFGT